MVCLLTFFSNSEALTYLTPVNRSSQELNGIMLLALNVGVWARALLSAVKCIKSEDETSKCAFRFFCRMGSQSVVQLQEFGSFPARVPTDVTSEGKKRVRCFPGPVSIWELGKHSRNWVRA